MELFGNVIIYIIMGCAVIGAAASLLKSESELGQQFVEGINTIGPIFLIIAGIFAGIPFITWFINNAIGPVFSWFGADPSMAAGSLLAVDMGAYQLGQIISDGNTENWMISVVTSYMLGSTIVFTIPVGLKMIKKDDQKYLGLGILSGILCVPIGVLLSGLIMIWTNPTVRSAVSNADIAENAHKLALTYGTLFINLLPLLILCVLIAIGLIFFPKVMIKGFSGFGRFIETAARVVLVLAIVEYFTGLFSTVVGWWGFDPIVADEVDLMRALEVSGYVGMMLAGAFPMVYMIQKYLAKPMSRIGKLLGLGKEATTGLLGACANALALFPLIGSMKPSDKVKTLAFTVCGAYIIGDHLSFTATFQPSIILPLFVGKLFAGVLSMIIAGYVFKLFMRKNSEATSAEAIAAEA